MPALLGALLVLYLIQVPSRSLARQLRGRQIEREKLLRRAIDASDLERRRIAADLDDSAVQRLAGVSLSLAASAARNGDRVTDAEVRRTMSEAAGETRETVRELCSLLVDIYPPTLQRSGLRAALDDVVAPLRADGVDVSLEIPAALYLPDDTEALFYRVAQEAVRNAKKHSEATAVAISVQAAAHQATLSVRDDGGGFASFGVGHDPGAGHFGLRLMRDLVDHAAGRLAVTSAPGEGIVVTVTVPVRWSRFSSPMTTRWCGMRWPSCSVL